MTKEDRDTWQSWLLDAIHKIRYQKQRPNVERVSACIRMHHPQYSNETVEEYLELAVSEGIVSKVLNKGLISYRDPGSAPGRGQKTLHITGDMDLCKMVLKCMRELEGDAAGGSPWIPLSRLEAHIREVYAVEESSSGVELGDLLLRGAKRGVSKGALSPSSDYSCFSLSGKAKKPSATSQGNPPQILTYVAYTAPTCCECLGSASSNPSGLPESLISCHTCGTSVHPSCRVYSTSLITHFINVGWTCDECKACLVCGASQKDEDLIICEYCDQGVHYSCLDPRPLKRPKVWDCDDCLIARGKLPNNNIRKMSNVLTSQITTPSLASLISGCVTTPILPPVSSGLMLPLIKVEGCNLKSQEERSPPLLKKDRKKNYSLPSGVTELDINLFTESQEAAKKSLHVQCYSRNLPGISELNFSNNSISPNVQIPLTQLPPLVSAGNSRSPLAIQFGEFEISTWYSSPYPQEYAR
uniref:Uncharacterized protein n=1 Tax=Lepeophtheirus salmonis TaxID=72036 RepID=A0A0K2TI91_LEPSM